MRERVAPSSLPPPHAGARRALLLTLPSLTRLLTPSTHPLSPPGIIKNSWSEKFANNGFINVQRGVQCGGMCGDPSICGNLYGTGDPASYYE